MSLVQYKYCSSDLFVWEFQVNFSRSRICTSHSKLPLNGVEFLYTAYEFNHPCLNSLLKATQGLLKGMVLSADNRGWNEMGICGMLSCKLPIQYNKSLYVQYAAKYGPIFSLRLVCLLKSYASSWSNSYLYYNW